jgi:hypothetical protein
MVIETRAPFDITNPDDFSDTFIELFQRNPTTGTLVLIAEDDNSGDGDFSKIDMVLPVGHYLVRITNVLKPINTPLHYLIGVFNETAMWGNGGGASGNDGNGGFSFSGGSIDAAGTVSTICPNTYLTFMGINPDPRFSIVWSTNVTAVTLTNTSQFQAWIGGVYSGLLNITATIRYDGNFVGSVMKTVWYGLPPISQIGAIVTPRANPINTWAAPIACQGDGIYFQSNYNTTYSGTTLEWQWEFTSVGTIHSGGIGFVRTYTSHRMDTTITNLGVGDWKVRVRSRNACGWSAWSVINTGEIPDFIVLLTSSEECGSTITPPILGGKMSNSKGYTLYPNPAKTELFVETDGGEEAELILSDKFGIERIRTNTQAGKAKLDVSKLATDLYILKIITQTNVFTTQVVVE